MANKKIIYGWYHLALSFFLFITSESRYLKNEENINMLSSPSQTTNAVEEDLDLGNFVEDYYDDLWKYIEKIASKVDGKQKKYKKNNGRDEFYSRDYDYLSDTGFAEPEFEEEKSENVGPNLLEGGKENMTFSHGAANNDSEGDFQLASVIRANRERSKEMRLKSIISQVLSFRGGSPKPNEAIPDVKHYNALREIYEKNMKKIKTEEWTSSYTEKVQSFYPSCEVPRNTDEDLWSDHFSMNLLFDLEYPNPQEDSTIMIVSAKLRLYKIPQENYSVHHTEGSAAKSKVDKNTNGLSMLQGDEDRQIRVSVYWYTRSLRRHRAKKKLLDSQMLSVYSTKWAEFNVRAAVRTWKDSGRNFGLVVTVEDEDGTLLHADQYLQSMNCSNLTTEVRPIPSIIMDRANQYFVDNHSENKNETFEDGKPEEDRSKVYPYEPLLYPTIDLRTREVPNSEMKNLALVNSAKIALESKYLNLSRRGMNLDNSSVTIFLKNYSDSKGTVNLSHFEKSTNRKSDSKHGDTRVSYFQNVPIGSPSKKSHGIPNQPESGKSETDLFNGEPDSEKQEERETPKIRHNRKQWESLQKTHTSKLRSQNDFNVTDHH